MKPIKLFIYCFLVLLCTGCSDYLDLEPIGTRTEANAYRTEKDAHEAVMAAYDPLQWIYTSEHTYGLMSFVGDMTSDDSNAGGESAQDLQYFYQFDNLSLMKNDNGSLRIIYRVRFSGIYRVNQALEKIPNIQFSDEALKNRYLAELRFLRAYYYMDLVRVFGTLPWIDKTIVKESDYKQELRSAEFIWGKIIEDLLAVSDVEALPFRKDLDASQWGRITRSGAWAFLAKAYVYTKDWDNAAKYSQMVIDMEGSEYKLMSHYSDNWAQSKDILNENTMESIFEVQYSNTSKGTYNRPESSEGSHMPQLQGPRDLKNSSKYQSGWGFNLPTRKLYDLYDDNDPRRLSVFLTKEELVKEGTTFNENFLFEGLFNKKYTTILGASSQDGDEALNWGINYRVMRYADLLLLAAEANCQKTSPDYGKAQTYLNRVRTRSLPGKDINASGNDLLEAIYKERRLELAMEGHRFFDLQRTNRAKDVIQNFNMLVNGYFPLPADEVRISGWNY
ncbi:MAG: hypothetical protein RL662_1041 [Bacteroidota bacterium]|jgi:hypothetical protein